MNGILLVNHFLHGKKYDELHEHLMKTAVKTGIDLKLKTNLELATEKAQSDFVLFWDKDINLAKRLELEGTPVFNPSGAIERCDDKAKTYLELLSAVPQPETLIAPKVFFKSDMSEFVYSAVEALGLPVVFKECFGSFGEQVYLCKSVDEILSRIGEKPFILQKFIKDSAGRDKRLEIVNGECVACVRRENSSDFRSNVTNGGKMSPCTATQEEIDLAVTACKRLGLTFGGVDILDGGLVCEVNSNAHIINIMNCSGVDIAPLIFKAITEKIR
ncbi:MAG: RimK family alpha-L-glutamate ligase [Eubacterium sp.]